MSKIQLSIKVHLDNHNKLKLLPEVFLAMLKSQECIQTQMAFSANPSFQQVPGSSKMPGYIMVKKHLIQ